MVILSYLVMCIITYNVDPVEVKVSDMNTLVDSL